MLHRGTIWTSGSCYTVCVHIFLVATGIDFSSLCELSIGFWNCSDRVVFCCFFISVNIFIHFRNRLQYNTYTELHIVGFGSMLFIAYINPSPWFVSFSLVLLS
jgi:hypothetical protein